MPALGSPRHHQLVHRLLHHAHALLVATNDDEEALPLTTLLTRAADHLSLEECADLDPMALVWLVAEAAGQLLACTRTPVHPQDPYLTTCLQALDQLSHAARVGLLTAAVRLTSPDSATSPTPSVSAQSGSTVARRRAAGPCPCPCSNGGFCGGCGHAGCRGRR